MLKPTRFFVIIILSSAFLLPSLNIAKSSVLLTRRSIPFRKITPSQTIVPAPQASQIKTPVEPAIKNFTQKLKFGSRGQEVINLQRFLAKDKEIYPEGLITGYFGPKTQKAVQKFQEKYRIFEQEGIGYGEAEEKTIAKLNELLGYNQPVFSSSTSTISSPSITDTAIQIQSLENQIKNLQNQLAQLIEQSKAQPQAKVRMKSSFSDRSGGLLSLSGGNISSFSSSGSNSSGGGSSGGGEVSPPSGGGSSGGGSSGGGSSGGGSSGGGTTPPSDTTAPSTPSNLTAIAISSSQINLSWTTSTDNVAVAGYRIYRNNSQVATSIEMSYSDTGLYPSTIYTYAVSAYDAAGNQSNQSSPISATTAAPPPPPPPGEGPKTYYVSSSGDDANSCVQSQNYSTPKKTIKSTTGCPAAGDTVEVASGTYPEMVDVPKSGTAANPITFKAASGATPIITGDNTRTNAFKIFNASYIVVDGFEIRDTKSDAISLYNSPGVVIKNNKILGKATRGIKTVSSDNLTMKNNLINITPPGTKLGPGIDGDQAHNSVISQNTVIGDYSIGIGFSESDNMLIERNWVQKGKGSDEDSGIEYRASNGGVIRNNIIEATNIVGAGMILRATGGTCSNNKVLNNTIHLIGGLRGFNIWGCSNIDVRNNIISHDNNVNVPGVDEGPGGNSAVAVDYNIIYNYTPFIDNSKGSLTVGLNNKLGINPTFQNSANSRPDPYYALQSGSPAIDAGDPGSSAVDVGSADFSDNIRIKNTVIDIGAFEF